MTNTPPAPVAKPLREWWITEEIADMCSDREIYGPDATVHVIEHSAYLELKERCERAEKVCGAFEAMNEFRDKQERCNDWQGRCEELTAEISQLKSALESKHNAMLDGAEKEYLLDRKCNELRAEIERFKEIISYLPKVPTQPYEKEMAKEIVKLKSKLSALRDTPGGKRLFFFMNENVRLAKELDELTRRLESPFHTTYDDVVKERDEFANAMALALREGIFANKASVKREIELLLAKFNGG